MHTTIFLWIYLLEEKKRHLEIEVLSHESYPLTCDQQIKHEMFLQLYLWIGVTYMCTTHTKRIKLVN